MVLSDLGFDEVGAQDLKGRNRPFFVRADQAGVADHVSDQNGGETAIHRSIEILPAGEFSGDRPRNPCLPSKWSSVFCRLEGDVQSDRHRRPLRPGKQTIFGDVCFRAESGLTFDMLGTSACSQQQSLNHLSLRWRSGGRVVKLAEPDHDVRRRDRMSGSSCIRISATSITSLIVGTIAVWPWQDSITST